MDICTFFGHRDTKENIYEPLKEAIIDLIENKGVVNFLVGNNGFFDMLAYKALKDLSEKYKISYNVVLAYLPKEKPISQNTVLPDGFEKFPPKFAIDRRNEYMLKKSKYIICYVEHYMGGAGKFVKRAEAKNKIIINLAEVNGN